MRYLLIIIVITFVISIDHAYANWSHSSWKVIHIGQGQYSLVAEPRIIYETYDCGYVSQAPIWVMIFINDKGRKMLFEDTGEICIIEGHVIDEKAVDHSLYPALADY